MALPPLTATTDADQLIPPSQDPWYTNAPPNLVASAPGTVLRIRTVPGGVGPFSSAATAYHILFRTTGSRYQPTWAVTQVIQYLLQSIMNTIKPV
jgi:hypothetical protein